MLDILIQGFEYDRWANLRWLEYLMANGDETDRLIFGHILSAQKMWLLRLQGTHPTAMPVVEATPSEIQELNDGWMEQLRTRTDDPIVEYRRLSGEAQRQHMSEIALHVVDHGTYHRGELRGLCRARGVEDFPETGFAGYCIFGRS